MRSSDRHVWWTLLFLVSGVFCRAEPAAAEILFKADFETGDFSQTDFDDILCATTLQEVGIRKPDPAEAKGPHPPRFRAVAFDDFVIFDPNSVIPAVERAFPGKGAEFARAWRAKQFEYAFLRSITDRHADFFRVTDDALVYTAAAMKLDLPPGTRRRLLDAYLTLKPWPDAVADPARGPVQGDGRRPGG